MPIRTLGDPVLKTPTKPVERFDAALRRLADDMLQTMYDAPGVGLAAPQVGISLKLFVFDDGSTGPMVMANPELVDADGELVEEEGCLSIPGPFYPTSRSSSIVCHGQDLRGPARPDLPTRNGSSLRHLVHRSAGRAGTQGRSRRAAAHRARPLRGFPPTQTTRRRRGIA